MSEPAKTFNLPLTEIQANAMLQMLDFALKSQGLPIAGAVAHLEQHIREHAKALIPTIPLSELQKLPEAQGK